MGPYMRDATLAFTWRQTLCRLLRYSLGPVGTGTGESPQLLGAYISLLTAHLWSSWFSKA